MPLDFPGSPSVNDVYSEGGRSWTWNGTSWVLNTYVGVVPAGAVGTTELAANAVTSAKIADGTIVNADVNASAAIAYSKLALSNTVVNADINSSAGIALSKLASGTAGQVVVANESGVPAYTEQSLGYRNVVINGAMQIAQRGTSVASITTSGIHTADRWRFAVASMGTWTQSVENDAPTGSGLSKSLKVLCTTADASPAAADSIAVAQRLEGQNVQQFLKGTASAKSFTLSFWVKSNVTGTYIVEAYDNDNTRQVSASYTIAASATWEKKMITFPADTTGAFDNDNGHSLQINFWLGGGSNIVSGTLNTVWAAVVGADRAAGQTNLAAATNNYWQITGVQLEAGSVATPFEFEDIGTTIAKCQRYFQKSYNIDVAPGTNTSAGASYFTQGSDNSGNSMAVVRLITEMRAAPTITPYTIAGTSGSWTYDRSGVSPTNMTMTTYYTSGNTINFYGGTGLGYAVVVIYGNWAAAAEL